MKKIYILKIGGSVATYKSSKKLRVRRARLQSIARDIRTFYASHPDIGIILIHGAGGPGHNLAHKYKLRDGTNAHKNGKKGAILSRLANQQLNTIVFDILAKEGLPVTPTHTATTIIQKNGVIKNFFTKAILQPLQNNYIPLLYGDMVFDEKIGMSICSGDTIAAHLVQHLPVTKLFFATDVNGVYTKDPHKHTDAKLITHIPTAVALNSGHITLTHSHNTDVTDGLRGKINSFNTAFTNTDLQEVHIFNGLTPSTTKKSLLNKNFPHTIITQ